MELFTKHTTANNPVLKIVAGALFILFPVIGFILGMQFQALNDQTINLPIPTKFEVKTTPQAEPAVDETANWKTYFDEKFGFSFRYSNDYVVTQENFNEYEKESNVNDLQTGFENMKKYQPPSLLNATAISSLKIKDPVSGKKFLRIWIFDNAQNLSIDEWFIKYWYYPFIFGEATPQIVEDKRPKKTINIGGVEGKYADITDMTTSRYFYFKYKNKMFLVKKNLVWDESIKKEVDFGNQILSTFKFTQ